MGRSIWLYPWARVQGNTRGVTQRSGSERIAELKRRLEEALKEIASLREANARLRKELEEWKRGHRERGKRRSSRPEGPRLTERLKPGRKKGHPGVKRKVPEPDRWYRFSDEDLLGDSLNGMGDMFRLRPKSARVMLSRPRTSLIQEILKSAENL